MIFDWVSSPSARRRLAFLGWQGWRLGRAAEVPPWQSANRWVAPIFCRGVATFSAGVRPGACNCFCRGSSCFASVGETIVSAGLGRAGCAERTAAAEGSGLAPGRLSLGETAGVTTGRAGGGGGGGLLGRGAGVPTGIAVAAETAGDTILPGVGGVGRVRAGVFLFGLTNRFGGRFGGGVASACILARAFCATCTS